MFANKPYILGLTGGIGCGKSMAAAYLSELGAVHVDADGISRALTQPEGAALQPIRERFGDKVFHEDGTLDRAALAELVFGNKDNKIALEAILHPMIQARIMDRIENAAVEQAPVVILDVPLLFETGMDALCDEVWAVSVPENVQLERVLERDGLSVDAARARIAGQMAMEERNNRADKVIMTDRPFEDTRAELSRLYSKLLNRLP